MRLKHKRLLIQTWFIRTFLFFLPDAPVMMRLRGFLYSLGCKSCGKNFQVTHSAILNTIETICVGNDVYIGHNVILAGGGPINIEDEVMVGHNAVIVSSNHMKRRGSFRFGDNKVGTITIGKGSWIGANCCLLPGSSLPPGSVLAANSLLNK